MIIAGFLLGVSIERRIYPAIFLSIAFLVLDIYILYEGQKADKDSFRQGLTTGQYKVIEKQTIVGEDTLYSNVIIDTTTKEEID